MGFLVMDEMFDCWTIGKTPYDYSRYFREWSLTDLRDAVRRDRNHPCIILYSAGNEIRDTRNAANAKKTLQSLVEALHETDPTRPITQALLRPNVTHDYTDGLADLLDVVGTNYRENELLAAHAAVPSRSIVGTEDSRELRSWLAMRDNRPMAGEFIWAGADYLGEGHKWPELGKENGLLDITNEPRPDALQRQSWWTASPMVSLARDGGLVPTGNPPGEQQTRPVQYPDWTPPNLQPHREKILVFSNCQSVELLLNGKSLGAQPRPPDDSPRAWTLRFVPGTVLALARDGGRIVARDQMQTAGKPAAIMLTADEPRFAAEWDGVCFVRATIVDAHGVRVPRSVNELEFSLSGPGVIAATENGDRNDDESFQSTRHKAYDGRCATIVKAADAKGGTITVTARSADLSPASIPLNAIRAR
jgi:beta-galactosidase